MKFFYRLENKYGKYAIRNLMQGITALYALGLLVKLIEPRIYTQYLSLDANAILHGQVWRIVTFLINPPYYSGDSISSIFFGIISLYLYYSIGQALERGWGAFRFNVYFFMGVLGNILASMVGLLVFRQNWSLTTSFLNFSLFIAFGLTYPDVQFLLFFIIPVKVRWLVVAECAVYAYLFWIGDASTRCEIVISLLNVIALFLMTRNTNRIYLRKERMKRNLKSKVTIVPPGQTRHRCAVCGRTEKDGGSLEFRYCSKCEGNYEYCQDHLYTHIHIAKDSGE